MVQNSSFKKLSVIVGYLNGKKFGYQTFYHGSKSNGPDHSISDHLNTKQVKIGYSDKFASGRFAIQIHTVHGKM